MPKLAVVFSASSPTKNSTNLLGRLFPVAMNSAWLNTFHVQLLFVTAQIVFLVHVTVLLPLIQVDRSPLLVSSKEF